MKPQFTWADAWILLSIIYAGSRAGLPANRDAINQAADFINHDWPTDEEIQGALSRLQQAGWIEKDGGTVNASDAALQAYREIHLPGQQTLKESHAIEKLLGIGSN